MQSQFSGGAGPDVFFIWGNNNQDWWNNGLKYSMNIGDALNSDPQGWGLAGLWARCPMKFEGGGADVRFR